MLQRTHNSAVAKSAPSKEAPRPVARIDLSAVKSRDGLYPLYKPAHLDDTSNIVIGQQVGHLLTALAFEGSEVTGKTGYAFRSAGHSSSDQPDPKLAFSRRTIWRSAGRRRVTREVAA